MLWVRSTLGTTLFSTNCKSESGYSLCPFLCRFVKSQSTNDLFLVWEFRETTFISISGSFSLSDAVNRVIGSRENTKQRVLRLYAKSNMISPPPCTVLASSLELAVRWLMVKKTETYTLNTLIYTFQAFACC